MGFGTLCIIIIATIPSHLELEYIRDTAVWITSLQQPAGISICPRAPVFTLCMMNPTGKYIHQWWLVVGVYSDLWPLLSSFSQVSASLKSSASQGLVIQEAMLRLYLDPPPICCVLEFPKVTVGCHYADYFYVTNENAALGLPRGNEIDCTFSMLFYRY